MEFATQTLCRLLFSRTFSTHRRSGPGPFRVYTACSSLCIRDQLCSELILLFPPPLFITDPLQVPLAGAVLARPCCRVLIQSICHLFFSAVNELFLACRKDISSSIHWIMFEGKLNSILDPFSPPRLLPPLRRCHQGRHLGVIELGEAVSIRNPLVHSLQPMMFSSREAS